MAKNTILISEQEGCKETDVEYAADLCLDHENQHQKSSRENCINSGFNKGETSLARAPYPIDWSGIE